MEVAGVACPIIGSRSLSLWHNTEANATHLLCQVDHGWVRDVRGVDGRFEEQARVRDLAWVPRFEEDGTDEVDGGNG